MKLFKTLLVATSFLALGAAAQSAGLDWDQTVLAVNAPAAAPSRYWIYIPAFLLMGLVIWSQRRRETRPQPVKGPRHA